MAQEADNRLLKAWDAVLAAIAKLLRDVGFLSGVWTRAQLRQLSRSIAQGLKEGKRAEPGRRAAPAYSQSAMKSVDANISRGRAAMNKAIAEKTTVHRAMFRTGLGWVDFEWGDLGTKLGPNMKATKGKGIAHMLSERMNPKKDGMTREEAIRFVSVTLPEVIARGETQATISEPKSTAVRLAYGSNHALLVKTAGANAWVVTAFGPRKSGVSDGSGAAFDASKPTHNRPTPIRPEVGADTRGKDDAGAVNKLSTEAQQALGSAQQALGSAQQALGSAQQTPEFRQWFEGSKVVDEAGQPRVLYHGTNRDITQFRVDRWVWASADMDLANSYAEYRGQWYGGEPVVMPVVMAVKQPFDLDRLREGPTLRSFFGELRRQSRTHGGIKPAQELRLNELYHTVWRGAQEEESGPHYQLHDFLQQSYSMFGPRGYAAIHEAVRLMGFDGAMMVEQGRLTFGAIRPEQVKSATGNQGTFDPFDPDIRYSAETSVESVMVEPEGSPVPDMVDADRATSSRLPTGPTGLLVSLVSDIQAFNRGAFDPSDPDIRYTRTTTADPDMLGGQADESASGPVADSAVADADLLHGTAPPFRHASRLGL